MVGRARALFAPFVILGLAGAGLLLIPGWRTTGVGLALAAASRLAPVLWFFNTLEGVD